MANLKSSIIEIRKIKKRTIQNAQKRARLRTYDKKVRNLVSEGNLEEAAKQFKVYASFLDRAGKTNLIHHRKADRKKSRIQKLINKAVLAGVVSTSDTEQKPVVEETTISSPETTQENTPAE